MTSDKSASATNQSHTENILPFMKQSALSCNSLTSLQNKQSQVITVTDEHHTQTMWNLNMLPGMTGVYFMAHLNFIITLDAHFYPTLIYPFIFIDLAP